MYQQPNGPFHANSNGPTLGAQPGGIQQHNPVFNPANTAAHLTSANVWPQRPTLPQSNQYPSQGSQLVQQPPQASASYPNFPPNTAVQHPLQNQYNHVGNGGTNQLNAGIPQHPAFPPSQSTMKLDATEGQYSHPPSTAFPATASAPTFNPSQPAAGVPQTFAPPPHLHAQQYPPSVRPPLGPNQSFTPSMPNDSSRPPENHMYQNHVTGGNTTAAMPPPSFPPQAPQPPMSLNQQFLSTTQNSPMNKPTTQYQQGLNPPTSPSTPDPLSLSAGFSRLAVQGAVPVGPSEQTSAVNILQFASPSDTRLFPLEGVFSEHVRPPLSSEFRKMNASPDVIRCTLNCIPQTEQLLRKSRLPLAVVLHPYKDLQSLALIQSSVIVRCKTCRAYINPFVQFLDQCHYWRCNICGRTNEVPDDFFYDPINRNSGSPMNRPEVKSATIEFIAPQEYCVRPPQPAVYAFLFDVSAAALQTGYLSVVCEELKALLDRLPGDKRRQMTFIAFDSMLHVFNIEAEFLSQPKMLTVTELDEAFLPEPDGLMVNFEDNREMISSLLDSLPNSFTQCGTTEGSAAGAALLLAQKLLAQTGGRITLFMCQRTTHGPGSLEEREAPSSAAANAKQMQSLIVEATDFYKKFALDCNSQQIGCDLFMLSRGYADLATLSGASKFSAGSVYYFPGFDVARNPLQLERFRRQLHRYLLRKIGFEAVLRVRCAKGLSLNSFHGNFFVRSTDLLSLANVNPDAGYAITLTYDESLADQPTVCFQVAILYTSSKSERRIRVHTLCLPTTNQLGDVFRYADQLAITSLLAKLAVDRSLSDSLTDAREALMSACVDPLASFAATLSTPNRSDVLLVPYSLRLLPILVLALLKNPSFATDGFIKADDRAYSMEQCRNLPPTQLILRVYPNLYGLNVQLDQNSTWKSFPLLRLSAASIQRHGLYLLDSFDIMLIYVCSGISDQVVQSVFDVPSFNHIADGSLELPALQTDLSKLMRELIDHNNSQRPVPAVMFIIKDTSVNKSAFVRRLIEDKSETGASTGEFLQYIQKELAK